MLIALRKNYVRNILLGVVIIYGVIVAIHVDDNAMGSNDNVDHSVNFISELYTFF